MISNDVEMNNTPDNDAIGAWVNVEWSDGDMPSMTTYISFGEWVEKCDVEGGKDSLSGMPDTEVFYYCENLDEMLSFVSPNQHEEGWSITGFSLNVKPLIISQTQVVINSDDYDDHEVSGTVNFGNQTIIISEREDE